MSVAWMTFSESAVFHPVVPEALPPRAPTKAGCVVTDECRTLLGLPRLVARASSGTSRATVVRQTSSSTS